MAIRRSRACSPRTPARPRSTSPAGSIVFVDPNRFVRRSIPLFARSAGLALLAATPTAIVAVQRDGDGTVALNDGKATKLVPGPPVCR
jgi:hypothetical protein